MKILVVIGGFLALIIAVAAIVLIIIAIAKGKIKTPGAPSGKTIKTIVVIVILAGIGWFGYRYFSEYEYRRDQRPVTRALSPWEAMPACAGAEYDFSKVEVPGKVVANFHTNCITAIKLPHYVMFRIAPSAEVKLRFINGQEFVDGPGPQYQNWAGVGIGREIFKAYGLNQSGTLEIFLEKRV